MKIAITDAIEQLKNHDKEFKTLFHHGSLEIELYKPDKIDKQTPHNKDEAYIVVSGSGTFFLDGDRMDFKAGDFLFVAAGLEHRFENFTDDFVTWVIFYGPEGGEKV